MPVVINEFEIAPEPPKNDGQATKKSDGKSGGQDQPPTDHEIKQLLQRRMERLERVSAN